VLKLTVQKCLNFHFFIYFRRVYLLLVCVAVRVLKLSVQKCLSVHFFIYFRRVYLLLVCLAVPVLKLTVQKCLNIHNFNTRNATQSRGKYKRLKYIKKINV
jgi:hypothetical protein